MQTRTGAEAFSAPGSLPRFSPDQNALATVIHDKPGAARITVWNVSSSKIFVHTPEKRLDLQSPGKQIDSVYALEFGPDNKLLAAAYQSTTEGPHVGVWDWGTGKHLWSARMSAAPGMFGLVFSHDGKYLLAPNSDGHGCFWRTHSGLQEKASSAIGNWNAARYAFNATDQYFLGLSRYDLSIIDFNPGRNTVPARTMLVHKGGPVLALSDDGRTVAMVGDLDARIKVWRVHYPWFR
jgi:WD40 repeat protein